MCGRYTLFDVEDLEMRFGSEALEDFRPNFNAAPGQTMPVITETGLEFMRWGLIPAWAKDEKIGYKLINARSESVFDKPVWRGPVRKKRCLIPANGFYEWQTRDDGKHPFYIQDSSRSLIYFAGVWESWKHEGKEWHTYSILTTTPNREMASLHDRMPVILHDKDEDQWLNASSDDELRILLAPYGDGTLKMHEVSREVNVARSNEESLIGPINSR